MPAGPAEEDPPVWLHVGVYAYRRAALERYATLPVGALELLEGLEQLRFLESGVPVALVELPAQEIWELNNASDVGPIEALLKAHGID